MLDPLGRTMANQICRPTTRPFLNRGRSAIFTPLLTASTPTSDL
jgi:hypothetical protein